MPALGADDLDFSDLLPQRAAAPSVQAAPTPMPLGHDDLDFSDLVPQRAASSTAADVAKSGGVGLVKGAMGLIGSPGGLIDGLGNVGEYAMQRVASAIGGLPEGNHPQSLAEISAANRALNEGTNILLRPADMQEAVERQTGPFYKPQTAAGKVAQTVGEFVPGAALMPGGTAANIARYGVAPALASEAVGAATQGSGYEGPARFAAAMLAPGAVGLASRAVTPFPIDAARQGMVDTLASEGVPLTAGQTTGNKPLRWMESTLSDTPGAGGRAEAIDEAQREAFTSAALRRIGVADGRASPDVLMQARDAIGQTFNDLSSRNTLRFDPQMGRDIGDAVRSYDSVLPSQQREVVNNVIGDITRQPGGQMPGTMYQETRSRLSRQADAIRNSDPALSRVFGGIRGALDGAMNRSITPEDQAAWQQARDHWGAYKVIEQAATGAGENAAMGTISPSALRNAAVAKNRAAYAVGQGPFGDLSRAGEALMKPLPNSGTAPRQYVNHLAGIVGAGIGGVLGGGEGAVLGSTSAAVAPSVLGRLLMSDPMQSYLGNQLLTGPASQPATTLDRLLAANNARQALPAPGAN